MSTNEELNCSVDIANLAEPLSFPTADTDAALRAKQTHNVGVTYG